MHEKTQLARRDRDAVAGRAADPPARRITMTPPVDVFGDSQWVTLWGDLPGVTMERLEVKFHDGTLYIEADAVVPTHRAGLATC
jgi:HSP20 family protein